MDRNRGGVRAVGGITAIVTEQKTRPNDTTQYAAGDTIAESDSAGTVWTFENCARVAGGSGVILSAMAMSSTDPSTDWDLELWLFAVAPTAADDNAALALTDAEARSVVAVIPIDTAFAAGSGLVVKSASVNEAFVCAAEDADLYGILVTRSTTTPGASDVIDVVLKIAQD